MNQYITWIFRYHHGESYKIITIVMLLSILLFSCMSQKNKDFSDKNINYYSKRIVIFWCPTEKEYNERISNLSEEEYLIFEDDLTYYNTMAMTYITKKEEEFVTDTNSSIGFIIGKDKIILNKKDFKYPLWKIILFDVKSKPVIVAPIEIATNSEEYSNFFDSK